MSQFTSSVPRIKCNYPAPAPRPPYKSGYGMMSRPTGAQVASFMAGKGGMHYSIPMGFTTPAPMGQGELRAQAPSGQKGLSLGKRILQSLLALKN